MEKPPWEKAPLEKGPWEEAPWRDPRYAPLRLEVERRADGALVLTNPTPVAAPFATAAAPLDHWAQAAPDRVWLAERSGEGWRTLTFGEAAARTRALAAGLAELGLGPDRPLLILARNGIDPALITYAALRIGAAAAPVSPQYGQAGADPARLAHALALIRPAAVFVDDAAAFGAACEGFAGPKIAARGAFGPWLALAALERGGVEADRATPDHAAKLLLTSGSTGAPKTVALSHANLAINAAQVAACFDDPDPPVMVNSAPWSHSLGAQAILHLALHRGGTLYIDHGLPTPARFGETLRNLGEVSPTYHNMVPAGWALLADALDRDLADGSGALARVFFARLRVMQYGGAGLPASVLARVQAAGVRATGERITFAAGYGVTETTPTAMNVHWLNAQGGLLGLPIPGTAVKLSPVPGGKLELGVRGPQLAPGYRTADGGLRPLPLDAEGFYPTGDAARLADAADPEQGLVFDGRLVENFKLITGAFVAAGPLRLAALSALGGLASDAVVCGEGRDGVGLLLFPSAGAAVLTPDALRRAVRAGLARLNGAARGSGGRIARALVLAEGPDAASGEVTDKGYINQALARARRAPEIARLFAETPAADVIVMGDAP